MKKFSLKYLFIYVGIIVMIGLVLYPVYDYIYSLIVQNVFKYTFEEHIVKPCGMGIIMGSILYFVQLKK